MKHRRFLAWNALAAVPFALAHVALGYFLGDVLTRFSPVFTRLALLALALSVALALMWWLSVRMGRLLPFVLSVGRSVVGAVRENPDVAAWAGRHPRLAGTLGHRLDSSRFGGLAATFLGLVFLYILFIWVGSVFDFLTADPIMQADTRVANLVHALWSPALLRVAAHVTALGDWRVVGALLVAAGGWLIVRGYNGLALGMVVAVVGDLASVGALKAIFDRPRPELAYFVESSGSFPSGHAAISVAFWGMLFYAAWRTKRVGLVTASLAASALAFAIGVSRIVLIEHYLTDVLNGWLVGALWLVVAVAVAEWRADAAPIRPRPIPTGLPRFAGPLAGLLLVGFAGWTVASYERALNIQVTTAPDVTVADISAALANPAMVTTTESVMGTPLEPINLIVLAPDAATLAKPMRAAGWRQARAPGIGPLALAAWAAWTDRPAATAPVPPYFWDGEPNALAFEKPPPDATLRKRHHVRIWRTRFVTAGGQRLFVGAASFDDGLNGRVFHHIDPNIDDERDTLANDLARGHPHRVQAPVAVSKPRLGTSVAGDPWFTDGAAAVIVLK